MKRKLGWVCLLVSPLVLGGAAFFLPDPDPITQANCARIKAGMTLNEVCDILGKAPPDCIEGGSFGGSALWTGARGRISVSYTGPFWIDPQNETPRVSNAVFTPDSRTILDKLWDWLGL